MIPPDAGSLAERLAHHLQPGALVAVGDGSGAPVDTFAALGEASRAVGGVHLLLGWTFALPDLDWTAFRSIRSIMGGHALRPLLADGTARYVPVRYGSVGPLLQHRLRPDVLLLAARSTRAGLVLGTEVSWLGPAMAFAGRILVERNDALPDATRSAVLPADRTTVLHERTAPPLPIESRPPTEVELAVAANVVRLVPERAALQFAPGGIGAAVLAALDRKVTIDSGTVTDDVVELDRRGLLHGNPLAAYAIGTSVLHEWADGRPMLAGTDVTHDVSRLGNRRRFIAVNTALQIDVRGQVNVEAVGGDRIGGVGGHADYALGASRSPEGLSIVALPSTRRGRSTLVARLDAAVTTPRTDIEVVVTEHGTADLRGLDDDERAAALRPLFPEVDPNDG